MAAQGSNISWTVGATFGLALGLSLLPLPEALVPLPGLKERPKETLLAVLTPARPKKAAEAPTIDWDKEAEGDDVELEPEITIEDVRPRRLAVTPRQRTKEDEAAARKWEVIVRKVQAAHAPIVDGCIDAACTATALTPWYEALRALRGDEPRPVRVVTIGTSLIASDHITDTARKLLQLRHGDGGLGFMFVDRPTRGAGRTVRSGTATEGWDIEKITDEKPFAQAGFSGAAFTAPTPQTTRFNVKGARRAELFLVREPKAGQLEVLADGKLLTGIDTSAPRRTPAFNRVSLPEGTKELLLRTRGGPVRLDGVALESELPGVTLDSLGLPGASAQVLLREDEALFAAQLIARSPSLVVLMLGGNDAFDMSLNRYDARKGKKWMEQLILRVKNAVPDAACLLASPPDAGTWRMDETIAPRTQTAEVAAYMRDLAKQHGCALWDMQAAMGGEGAVVRWWDAGLMNRDLVHPLGIGGDVLGYLFETALERARQAHLKRRGRTPQTRGRPSSPLPDTREVREPARYLEGSEWLNGFFEKLRTLEGEQQGRVAIAQLGASHTAGHFFTDEARAMLAERFGSAGRGYVAAGKPSPRLDRSGVKRALYGDWKVTDALNSRISGFPWGLTGIRAEGGPDAQLYMAFNEPGGIDDDTAHLQLHYYQEAGQPPPEVIIDDTELQLVVPEATVSGTRVIDFAAPGPRHEMTVSNPGPGPLSVFGVSQELMRPGIIYDALGLPGSTAPVFASYDGDGLVTQLAARAPDLFVFFFGTNEAALPISKVEEMRAAYPEIFARLRRASPNAECLILAPTDRMEIKKRMWRNADSMREVVDAMREVARENHCAFWDTHAAMGGVGSINVWRQKHLALNDRVHLTPEGYRRLAREFMSELLRDYDEWRAR